MRGRLDSLQPLTLLVSARARADGREQLAIDLDSIAAYRRELLAAEYHLRPPGPLRIAGMDGATLHRASHHPEEAVGLPHLVPDGSYPEVMHWLNWLRHRRCAQPPRQPNLPPRAAHRSSRPRRG